MIERPEYIKKLLPFKDKKLIKIVTGVRRCGKSTMFELYQEELKRQGVKAKQIQSINLEDLDNEPLKDYHKLYKHITKNLVPDKKNYVFLDEIQVVEEFGQVVNSLYLKGNIDVYLTGSNSKVQSKDIASKIEREYVTIPMFPLSFKEYLTAWETPISQGGYDDLYDNYLTYSSFPNALSFRNAPAYDSWDKTALRKYLNDLYEKIVLKDIVENKNISDISRLESVIKFMADNISKETSINNIANAMTSSGRKIDNKTVESYIEAFCDSFVLYKANRYDVKGKEFLKTQNKYYLVDLGLRYLLLGDKKTDSGKILENVVYLELLRRGYNVHIGKVGGKEIDFVAEGANGTEYYQVSETIRSKDTFAREAASLDAITDHNPKFILTRDYETASYNGIKIQNVLKWLAGQE
ncbi:MAG: ATP-binding protein [Endomicrobium sp.]|jgi:predicted AAA+ superfamily ATPase|nr:ATP-binding protein [Endomicrobium sp.]